MPTRILRTLMSLLTAAVLGLLMPLSASAAAQSIALGPELLGATRLGTDTAIFPDASRAIEIRAADPDGMLSVDLLIRWDDDTEDTGATRAQPLVATYDEVDEVWRTEAGGGMDANERPKRWSVTNIQLVDRLHNITLITDRRVLDPLGFTFENPSYDAVPPVLDSVTVDPKIAVPGEDVRVTLRVKDANKPVEANYILTDRTGSPDQIGPPGMIKREVVDEGNGITAFTDTFITNDATAYGRYSLDNVVLIDKYHNYEVATTDAAVTIDDPEHPVGASNVSGTMRVGNTLTANANWPGAIMDYRWTFGYQREPLANGPKVDLTWDYQPPELGLQVTGKWPDGTVRTRHTTLDAVGKGKLAINSVSITGNRTVGSILSATHPLVVPAKHQIASDIRYAYVWFRDGKPILGAPQQKTYKSTVEDIDRKITVRLFVRADAYDGVELVSVPFGVVGVLKAPLPTITGAAGIGSTFTANPGSWTDGTKLSYQWLRNGKPIAKATAKAYTSSKADLNQVLQVRVTGSKPGYTSVVKTSASKRPVTGKFTGVSTPVISGTARVGSKISVTVPSPWVPADALKYQWLRNGKPIKGATAKTYTTVAADLKQKVSVKVTASKTGYTTVARTSSTKTIGYGILKEGTLRYVGSKKVGTTVKVQPVGWGAGNTYSYQWKRDGNTIKGATKSVYKLQRADRGRAISVTMTVKRSGFITIIMGDGTFAPR